MLFGSNTRRPGDSSGCPDCTATRCHLSDPDADRLEQVFFQATDRPPSVLGVLARVLRI
jgi:hypothetical protein